MSGTVIRGLSWDHPRGHAPLVAVSEMWAHARGGVRVEWTPRSLADFAAGELDGYVGTYDIVACDHPLVGRAAAEGWLRPLEGLADEAAGASYASYVHDGRLYAAPVDAAALTLARRPDLLPAAPVTWDELLTLARESGRVAVPFSRFSAAALYATFCAEAGIDPYGTDLGRMHALECVAELAPYVRASGSVELLRTMATTDDLLVVAWPYGYSTWSRDGAPGRRLAFTDPPSSVPGEPSRPTLGGVGLGLLSHAPAAAPARELIAHLAGADAQCGLYTWSGGQPAHAAAWDDPALDAHTGGFLTGTRASLERAYVRPNAAWFDHAQPRVGDAVQAFAAGRRDAAETLTVLDAILKEARA